MSIDRRAFLQGAGALGALALTGCAGVGSSTPSARVVVIGGGYGGATAAKYLKLWEPRLDVVLVERNPAFVSCPMSNLILAGAKGLGDVTVPYDALVSKYGVKLVRDEATAIDPEKKQVRLANGAPIGYDRAVVAPGIELDFDPIPGLKSPEARERVLHAWRSGPQTVALRKQLEALPDGGVYAIHIPKAPYRCPPGPYERACLVASYFKQKKPKAKVLVLDSNEDLVSKKALFTKVWSEQYKGIIEYRPNSELRDVDAANSVAILEFDRVKADVLNVIPPQSAGVLARSAGLITANNKWCGVDFLSFESAKVSGIHVIGDAIAAAPAMPKSGFMANNHAKVAADAIVSLLAGRPVNPDPIIANTCYSFVSETEVVHIASVHKYDKEKKTLVAVQGAGGLSTAPNDIEAKYALSWAKNIWQDALG